MTIIAPVPIPTRPAGALRLEANITDISPSCTATAIEPLRADVQAVLNSTGRELDLIGTCGGKGRIGELFDTAIVQGLCEDMMTGVVSVFVWQMACGLLLLLLAVLLPGLWHSHFFPPMACRCRPYRGFLRLHEMITGTEGTASE